MYYIDRMIIGFKSKATARFWDGEYVKTYAGFAATALIKLDYLARARDLADLRALPGNRLEAPRGDRKGQHAIRINDQHRICFVWDGSGFDQVEIVD